MNYSEVLNPYQPLETGDFMYRYYINDREYIIYSPERNKISCLELFDFKDLSAYQLSVSIQAKVQVQSESEELKEFSFDHVCSKEDLIAYLFDITEGKTEIRKVRKVSNNEGYFLFELKSAHKIRNFYQFSPESKENQLVFDKDICCAAIYEDVTSDVVNVCWNPVIFSILEGQTEQQNTSYLLPSSNPILCAHVCKKAQERNARINLYVGKNGMEALLFFSYYIASKGIEKSISIFSDSKQVTVEMDRWNPVTVVKLMSKMQKTINDKLRKQFGEEDEVTIYRLESVAGKSFLAFQNHPLAIDVFFRNIIPLYGLENIEYIEMPLLAK